MIKEIKYNGYTTQPSDYQSTDGDLARSYNLLPENGALTPIMPPSQLASFPGALQVFIHANNFSHYIIAKKSNGNITFQYADTENLDTLSDAFLSFGSASETLRSIAAIGNMLLVSSSEKMYYLIWKDGAYNFLGNSLPDIEIQFALDGEVVAHSYTDALASKKGTATTGEGWTTLASVPYQYSGDYTDVDTVVGSAITLKADTDYRFTNTYKGSYITIYGTNASTSQQEVVAQVSSNKHKTVRTSAAYSSLKIMTLGGSRPNFLTIEQGQTFSVNLDYVIDNTADNFNALLAMVNSFRENYATKRNRFIHPFFIRYAIRLYDGSYARISTPILMVPNSGYVPLFSYPQASESGVYVSAYAFIADLQIKLVSSINDTWKDIIDSVDFFVSQPIYPYNQGKSYDASDNTLFTYKILAYDDSGSTVTDELSSIDYGFLHVSYNGAEVDSAYARRNLYSFLNHYYSLGSTAAKQWPVIQAAPRTDEEISKALTDNANFYLVHSMPFSQLSAFNAAFADLPLDDGVLQNLVNRTSLSDELMASRSIATASLYAYNNRVHAFNADISLPTPTPLHLQNNYVSPRSNNATTHVYVFIHSSQGEKVAHFQASSLPYIASTATSWFFYPDNNAYRALFIQGSYAMSVELSRHAFLNGAYWFSGSLSQGLIFSSLSGDDLTPPTNFSSVLSNPSAIYVSEVSNPFTFLSTSTVAVGGNKVQALATAAKPLSTGQFGQFPLYAFTDNGVWALETSTSGAYTARQPITRDVCANPNSICQLESSVLFATERGVMQLSGSTATCITDIINSEFPFNLGDLSTDSSYSARTKLFQVFNDHNPDIIMSVPNASIAPFSIFLKACRIIYDYPHQRIYLLNASMPYAYVYSLKDNAWGMAQANISLIVNSYPNAQAVDADGNLIDFSQTDDSETTVFLLTRPFAMGTPDTHKTVQTILQRGFFASNLQQVLYASNDLFHWHTVASSRSSVLRYPSGSPYKFFRIAVIATLADSESLYGFTAQYQPKLTNQPR